MPQNKPVEIVSLTAQTQQFLSERLRPIQLAAKHVIDRLPKGYPKELRRRTQLFPQLSCAGIRIAGFWGGIAFNGS